MKRGLLYLLAACIAVSLQVTSPGSYEVRSTETRPLSQPPQNPTELELALQKQQTAIRSRELTIPVIKTSTLWSDKPGLVEILKAAKLVKEDVTSDAILKTDKISGGSFSGKVFIVTLDESALTIPSLPNRYVIKEVVWTEVMVSKRIEQTPQTELQSLRLIADKIEPIIESHRKTMTFLPQIAKSRGIFKLYRKDSKETFLTVMDLAPGEQIYKLVNQYKSGSLGLDQLKNIIKDLGKAVGSFHLLFADPKTTHFLNGPTPNLDKLMTTIHGDLHFSNAYWKQDKPIQYIDVATMALSINSKVPCTEASYTYMKCKYFHQLESEKEWINTIFEAFADGYASTLAPENQSAIKAAVIKLYKKWSTEACKGYKEKLTKGVESLSTDKPAEFLAAMINKADLSGNPQLEARIANDTFCEVKE